MIRFATVNQARQLKRLGVRYQSQLVHSEFEAEREAIKHHATEAAATWKKIISFVCIPAFVVTGINAYRLYTQHSEHMKEHPMEWVKYPYMNYRAKDFFWGKEALLYNPRTNLSAEDKD